MEKTLRSAILDISKDYAITLSASLDSNMRPAHRFSRGYRIRKKALINAMEGRQPISPAILRRRILVPLVAILMIMAIAMSVQAIRGPVVSFVQCVYEEMTDFILGASDNTKSKAATALDFTLSYVPEGFKLVNTVDNAGMKMEVYEDRLGGDFSFAIINQAEKFSIDTEGAVVTETTLQDKKTVIAQKDTYILITVFDLENQYVYNYSGTLSLDEAVKVVENAIITK